MTNKRNLIIASVGTFAVLGVGLGAWVSASPDAVSAKLGTASAKAAPVSVTPPRATSPKSATTDTSRAPRTVLPPPPSTVPPTSDAPPVVPDDPPVTCQAISPECMSPLPPSDGTSTIAAVDVSLTQVPAPTFALGHGLIVRSTNEARAALNVVVLPDWIEAFPFDRQALVLLNIGMTDGCRASGLSETWVRTTDATLEVHATIVTSAIACPEVGPAVMMHSVAGFGIDMAMAAPIEHVEFIA